MGNSLEQWRGAIGSFAGQTWTTKRRKERFKCRGRVPLQIHILKHTVVLFLLALAPSQDTHQNAVLFPNTSVPSLSTAVPSSKTSALLPWAPSSATMLNMTLSYSLREAQNQNNRSQSFRQSIPQKISQRYLFNHRCDTNQRLWTGRRLKNHLMQCNDIETNPGPLCCKMKEYFNRIENLAKQMKRDFQSKVVPTTLTEKLIPVDATGCFIKSD